MIWDTVSCYYGLFLENCFINKRCCVIVLHNFCYIMLLYIYLSTLRNFILFFFTIGEKVVFYTFIVLPLL
ncbi:hypothetical protein SEEM9199_00240 [Salmonella enterica subsp. enterica serovar Montevideo str. IA_2009159199]|nr:hypothetical protein SEEM9199_00240 [Salmonella enterica subsp. enterica serovar Montevideo str. IA_2009159199]